MEKSNIITALKERLDNLEKWQAEKKEPTTKKKSGAKKEADEEVCPICGADLLFVEEGIVLCPKCNQYFEFEEEE